MTAPSFDPDYFPARLNAPLNAGRYKILRKLGQGPSSSSWLVHNPGGEVGYTYLAAKILTIDATRRHDAGQIRELEFLKELAARDDSEYLVLLCDHFVEEGPVGKHLCLVEDLCSTSVSSLRGSSPQKALPPYMVRNVVSMLLDALAQLHAMRIVHADVNPDNLLFGNPLYYLDDKMQRYLEENPTEVEGEAQLGQETYPIFKSQPIPNGFVWNPSALVAETMLVYLTGLGHAQRAGEQPTANYFGAPALRAPETILQFGFGPAIDIWAVGCMTFELLVGRPMFHPVGEEDWEFEGHRLAKMMELTGQTFPAKVLERAKLRKEYFDTAGKLLRVPEPKLVSLETVMANYKIPWLSEDEIELAAGFIRACLKFDPEERPPAEELRGHEYLADAFGS